MITLSICLIILGLVLLIIFKPDNSKYDRHYTHEGFSYHQEGLSIKPQNYPSKPQAKMGDRPVNIVEVKASRVSI